MKAYRDGKIHDSVRYILALGGWKQYGALNSALVERQVWFRCGGILFCLASG